MNKPHGKENLCTLCKWSKDKVQNEHVTACFCVNYGYIVAHRKERCKGFESMYMGTGVNELDGNAAGTDSISS